LNSRVVLKRVTAAERVQRPGNFRVGKHGLAGRAFQEQACDPVAEPEREASEPGRLFVFLVLPGQAHDPSLFLSWSLIKGAGCAQSDADYS